MTRTDSRILAFASAALFATATTAQALTPIPLAGYSCKADSQISAGSIVGLIATLKIQQEITIGAQECAKACTKTAGCIAVNVKEVWENGQQVTYCQMYSKVTGTTPYTLGTDGTASWGFACLNISRVKWTLPKYETDSAQPHFPPTPGINSYQDASRPGDSAPVPGHRR